MAGLGREGLGTCGEGPLCLVAVLAPRETTLLTARRISRVSRKMYLVATRTFFRRTVTQPVK